MVSEEQFIRFFVKYEAEFRAFGLTLMLRPSDTDDLVQEACVAMWRKISTLESEKSFRSWGYSFIRFMALNLRRKQQRSLLLFSDELLNLLADESEAEGELIAAEHEALAHCIEALPDTQKEIIAKYYSGSRVTVAELSEEVKRSVAALYKVLERARTALRTCIEGRLEAAEFSN